MEFVELVGLADVIRIHVAVTHVIDGFIEGGIAFSERFLDRLGPVQDGRAILTAPARPVSSVTTRRF